MFVSDVGQNWLTCFIYIIWYNFHSAIFKLCRTHIKWCTLLFFDIFNDWSLKDNEFCVLMLCGETGSDSSSSLSHGVYNSPINVCISSIFQFNLLQNGCNRNVLDINVLLVSLLPFWVIQISMWPLWLLIGRCQINL